MKLILWIDRALAKVEAVAVCLVLFGMILASAAQASARALSWPAPPEIDVLVRFGVLWMAALGGALAAQRRRHLAVDAVLRFAPDRLERGLRRSTAGLAAAACAGGALLATRFVWEEWAMGRTQAGLPEAALLSVLPVGFGLMALHFAVGALDS